jgi:aryl-alcohol dehydrogenase-like predicted oxidoreductase
MQTRQLGKSGLEVSPICLGGNVFGWTADEAASWHILDAWVDRGFNFVDTADIYSRWMPGHEGGESETVIGKWFSQSDRREKVVLATKAGMEMGPEKKGLSKAYLFRAVEDSLTRLQTDYIDLYQSHQDDPQTPLEETLDAFTELIRQGKVRAIGASNYSAPRLREALETASGHGYARYESLQPLYNLYDRQAFEAELEPVCLEYGIGVIPYFSLASGFLSGKYRSEADTEKGARGPMIKKYLNERGTRILGALDKVAAKIDAKAAQVAIAWLIARPSVTAPIASATNLNQLDDLARAAELRLDPESIELLNQASE